MSSPAVILGRGRWRRWFHWRKDEDASNPRSLLPRPISRPSTPSVSSPFNVRRMSYLDVNLHWHGEGAHLSAMLELIGHPIGRGGFSDVYLARLRETQGMYACKVFRHVPYGGGEEEAGGGGGAAAVVSLLIQREMDALRTLRHEHVVSYFGCLASPSSHHLALLMELCDGGSVKDLLHQSSEPLRERHIAHVLRCVLLALQHLHGLQLVHRDVKGANILLTTQGQAKLGDLGISANRRRHAHTAQHTPHTTDAAPSSASYNHPSSSSSSSSSSASPSSAAAASPGGSPDVDVSASPTFSSFSCSESPLFSASPNSAATPSSSSPYPSVPLSHPSQPMGGTPLWMSPECLAGAEPDFSGDVWALGITALEMTAGHPPHTDIRSLEEICAVVHASPAPSLAGHAPHYPASPDFHHFIDLCLHKDPQQRATVADLLAHPFITQCSDPPSHPAVTANGLHPPSGSHLGVPVSPRGSLSPLTPPSSDGMDGCPPPPMLQPRRSVSCPSPRTPHSPRPSSTSLATPADADFCFFIVYGRYPTLSDSDPYHPSSSITLHQPFDDRPPSPLPRVSSQRRFSTSSPAPPSPAVSPMPSSLMDKLARIGGGSRRPSLQTGGEATPPPPNPLALLPLRANRQLSVPSPRAMPSSSLSTPQSLSPSSSFRSPSRTPIATSSPLSFTPPSSRGDHHPPPTLRLPPPFGSFRSRKSQGQDSRLRSEHKEATPSPRTDSEDGDATPATPFRLVVNDEPAVHAMHLRRAQSLDYGRAREVQGMAREAAMMMQQPMGFAHRRRSLRVPEEGGRGGGMGGEGRVVISLDITPRQIGGDRSGGAGSGDEEEEDTPSYLPPSSLSPESSPSPADLLPHRSSSIPAPPRASPVFSFAQAFPPHDDEGEDDVEVDDADAEVVYDLDDAFADLTKEVDVLAGVGGVKEERRGGGGVGEEVGGKLGMGVYGRKAPPPLIALSLVTATSGSSVDQLCVRHHIDLTPSPSPRPYEDDRGKEEEGRPGWKKANSLPIDKRDEATLRLTPTPPAAALRFSFGPLSLHTAASSPELLGVHTSEGVGVERLSFDVGMVAGPFPSPSSSTLASPSASALPSPSSSSPSSSSPSPLLGPTSISARRPVQVSQLRLPNTIVDDEPVSRSPAHTPRAVATPLSARASFRGLLSLAILPPSPSPVSPLPSPTPHQQPQQQQQQQQQQQHDSYIISDHGTLITSQFCISAEGKITSPDEPPFRTLNADGAGGVTPRAISPCPSPSLPLTPRGGLSGAYPIPIHSRSFSTPSVRTGLGELPVPSPSPVASPPSHPPFDPPTSPLPPQPLRRLSSQDASAPLQACLRAEDLVEMGDIGAGQHGVVRKALHLPSLTLVALKTMSMYDRDARHQLYKELKAFSKLHSDHLVSFLGAYHRDGQVIMGSEYCDCGSLLTFVQKNAQPLTPLLSAISSTPPLSPTPLVGLPSAMLRHIARQVVLGLEYLHRCHLVHRDVKPDNVLMNHAYVARIGDFGLTTQLEHSRASISLQSGTIAYLSPERSRSFPADIWSLGMTIAHAAATRRSHEHGGSDPFQIHRALEEVQAMLQSARADDECHRTFPHPPCFRTAFMPSEISDVYHEEELRSFLAACLQFAPQQRWTATQLLQHPFIHRVASPSVRGGESGRLVEEFGLPAGFEKSSCEDLQAVCRILCESYPLCALGHSVEEECGVECQLQLDDGRVRCLAVQFGKSGDDVRQAFADARRAHRNRERR